MDSSQSGIKVWLVCGGRNIHSYSKVASILTEMMRTYGVPDRVVSGAARGVDTYAAQWARSLNIHVCEYPADWNTHGRAAGPIRNKEMLDKEPIDIVIAIAGGVGTANMVEQATKRGISVTSIYTA